MTTSSAGHWIRGLARLRKIVTHITHVESHVYHFDVLQKKIICSCSKRENSTMVSLSGEQGQGVS